MLKQGGGMTNYNVRPVSGWRVLGGTERSQAATMILANGESTGELDNKHAKSDQWLYVVAGEDPMRYIFWNAFAWHPFYKKKGILSNRKPRKSEIRQGITILKSFLKLFPRCKILALGKTAEWMLSESVFKVASLRHPAQGGAKLFRRQLKARIRSA